VLLAVVVLRAVSCVLLSLFGFVRRILRRDVVLFGVGVDFVDTRGRNLIERCLLGRIVSGRAIARS
jgi:hypothetical protein